jgi:predicted methyltransferase
LSTPYVLCAHQLAPLFAARQASEAVARVSLDLGLTFSDLHLEGSAVHLPAGPALSWQALQVVLESPQNCFAVTDAGLEKIQAYSEYTQRHYVLMATESAPTMLVSGIPMHRIKGTNPHADTLSKLRAARPVVGQVLDTTTGLGYTAIQAARTAERVITIELDPTVLELIRQNPWSQPLLEDPKIQQIIGDSYDLIDVFSEAYFARIIHDPPTVSLAGELYSADFYQSLYRVLAPAGILFHYIGDLDSKLGSRVARGARQRLQAAGFRQIIPRPEAFGLVARK